MIVVLLGPPGSGKGTQAKMLSDGRHWPQLSTGDMLRTAISKGTKLGAEAKVFMDQGKLVPDSVVVGLIEERTMASDCKSGFILDGFPRNNAQAATLDAMLAKQSRKVDKAVLFEIPDGDLVGRISGRRTCVQCGSMFHVHSLPPKVDGICDKCGSTLVQRPDDSAEVITKRLVVYHQQTAPLVEYYSKQGKLNSLNAKLSTTDVARSLSEALK